MTKQEEEMTTYIGETNPNIPTSEPVTKQEEIRQGLEKILAPEGTQRVLRYLHSQGVVIKVDRQDGFVAYRTKLGHEIDIAKNVVAVEPLIKE